MDADARLTVKEIIQGLQCMMEGRALPPRPRKPKSTSVGGKEHGVRANR